MNIILDNAPVVATTPTRYLDDIFTDWTVTRGEYKKGYEYDVYQPVGDTITNRPVVIVYHAGGGEIEDVKKWCTDFVKKGYVVFSAEYKLTVGDFNAEAQKDAVINSWELIDYIRTNYVKFGIKKKKIFEMGISAGALTAIQSGIGLNDKSNPYFGNPLGKKNKLKILATATLSGAANPDMMNFINLGDPPNYFYHGTEDKTIPYAAALATYTAQIAAGIPSNFMKFDGKGHKLESHDIILADLKTRFYGMLNV